MVQTPYRHVHEEDPVPVHGRGEHPAEQQPDRSPGRGDEAVDADRPRLLPRLGNIVTIIPRMTAGGGGPADALQEPGGDQHLPARRQPAQRGREREHDQTRQENATPGHQVTEPAGEQQQAPERDQVRVDHPGQPGPGEAQLALDRRQGDVHDRDIQNDHQHPCTEHQ
jgi:hypothetical protein